jgi:S1-C subfamily serine protease
MLAAVITSWLLASASLTGISYGGANASASASLWQIKENAHSLSPQARARIRRAMDAVGLVLVRGFGEEMPPRPRGSAVVIHQDGIVVTNYHVIAQDKSARVYDEIFFALPQDGAITKAETPAYQLKTVLVNKEMDLALLRITSAGDETAENLSLPTVELGDSRVVRELDDLVIIGYPEKGGTTVTVNSGTVEGRDILENWIKTDARLIRGNSGGAAVDSEGRLIGIPTKVVVDRQPIDKNGDGFPDGYNALGAIGFLRPSHLVASMLAQVRNQHGIRSRVTAQDAPHIAQSPELLNVSGRVKAADDGKPVAGVAIGLVPEGETEVSSKNILTWGYSNPDGVFRLNKLVPPGRYTLKAKTFGYEIFTTEVEINKDRTEMIIELRRSR